MLNASVIGQGVAVFLLRVMFHHILYDIHHLAVNEIHLGNTVQGYDVMLP